MLRRRSIRALISVLLPIASIMTVGCGDAGYGEVPVSGKVTLNGEPLAGAHLTFQPVAKDSSGFAPGSFGRTDDEGNFSLRTVWPDADGAIPGRHRVQISFEDPSKRPPEVRIPQEYREGRAIFEVPPEGTEEALLELDSGR